MQVSIESHALAFLVTGAHWLRGSLVSWACLDVLG